MTVTTFPTSARRDVLPVGAEDGSVAALSVDFSEQEMLAMASARVPQGVLCLLPALRFHGLTTQNPSEIWLAIDRKARAPIVSDLPLRVVRFSGEARTAGIEKVVIDGVDVRVYGVAKTVADCFKYRNKIGTGGPCRRRSRMMSRAPLP
jgi:predicted transcriptional regulator of viral defense system